MSQQVEVGPVSAKRGTKSFGMLPIAISANGGQLGIGVHIVAGHEAGPKVVLMTGSHGNELTSVASVKRVLENVSAEELTGDLVVIPMQNPVAFEMGSRGTWIDGIWGDSGNMNRLWPGRSHGWLTERFTSAIAAAAFPGANLIMDLHGPSPDLHVSYGYLGEGQRGDLDYDVARAFGQEMLAWNDPEALKEKGQTTSTAKAAARLAGFGQYSGELGDFYGVRVGIDSPSARLKSGPEIGYTGIMNVMKYLGMLAGELQLPAKQISVTPELNLRPSHGGLLETHVGIEDLGTVLTKGTPLGTVVSPHSFEVLDEIVAPFDETLLIGTSHRIPWTKVHPGDYGYIVADHKLTEELPAW